MHVFLTSALVGGEWSASRPGRFKLGKMAPGTHWIWGWVSPRTGLDDVEKRKILPLTGLELRPIYRPARSQSLYRLRYPSSQLRKYIICISIYAYCERNIVFKSEIRTKRENKMEDNERGYVLRGKSYIWKGAREIQKWNHMWSREIYGLNLWIKQKKKFTLSYDHWPSSSRYLCYWSQRISRASLQPHLSSLISLRNVQSRCFVRWVWEHKE
jgi:hypothetical protein